MTMMPAADPAHRDKLFLYASAHVSPEDDHADLEEALRAYVKEEEEQIKEDLRLGLASFERAKPAAQLHAFLVSTLPQDLPLVLAPGWYEARQLGMAEPLAAETMYAQEQARIATVNAQAQMMGVPTSPPREPLPTDFWPLILKCRAMVFKQLVSQFRTLVNDEWRKQNQGEGEEV